MASKLTEAQRRLLGIICESGHSRLVARRSREYATAYTLERKGLLVMSWIDTGYLCVATPAGRAEVEGGE